MFLRAPCRQKGVGGATMPSIETQRSDHAVVVMFPCVPCWQTGLGGLVMSPVSPVGGRDHTID